MTTGSVEPSALSGSTALRHVFSTSRFLALPGAAQVGLWLLPILILKSGSLFEPPVWDSAMGVFPPAIYLYENHFDIRGLLAQPNWWMGGPNVHSLSLFTWFVALVMTVTGSATATFAIVHVTTFALVAWSLVLFTRVLARDGFEPNTVLAAGAFVLLMPLVLVQVGYLYTESWVMVFSVAAWSTWREGNRATAVLLCVVALFVKLTGIAIGICVVSALVLARRPSVARRFALLSMFALAFCVHRALPGWLDARSFDNPGWGDARQLGLALVERLGAIPDVTIVVVGSLVGTVLQLVLLHRRGVAIGSLLGSDRRVGAQLICLAMPFVFCVGIIASIFSGTIFLGRYVTPVIPFSVASILYLARELGRERIAFVGCVAGCVISLVNFDGSLYPEDHQSFSIVERSHAYRKFHRFQIESIAMLRAVPENMPIFVSKEIDYMVSSPMMGYVAAELPQVQPIHLPPFSDRPLSAFPPEFVLLFSNSGHGGEVIARLARSAERDPAYQVRYRPIESEGFSGALIWIRRVGGAETSSRPAAQPQESPVQLR